MTPSLTKPMVLAVISLGISPAYANIDPPWGFPDCPTALIDEGRVPQPYAPGPTEYDGIYKLVEAPIAPFAPYFFPVLQNGFRPPPITSI